MGRKQGSTAGRTPRKPPLFWLEKSENGAQAGVGGTGTCKESLREDSQRKEVPNSGYICRSLGLTLSHTCVTHSSQ